MIGYFEGVYNYSKDPYNTFDYIMSKSEQIGVKSHFYFMSDNNCEYIYTKDFAEIIEKIKNNLQQIIHIRVMIEHCKVLSIEVISNRLLAYYPILSNY